MTESEFDQTISRALEQLSRLGIIIPHEGEVTIHWTFNAHRFSQLYQVSRNRERLASQEDIIIEKADKFTNFRENYIYIWWNGLEVGQYAQSTPFIFIPAQRMAMGIEAAISTEEAVQGFGMAFPHWRNGSWMTTSIFPDTIDMEYTKIIRSGGFHYALNVHQGFDYLRSSFWIEGRVGGNSESNVGYRAYAIKIEDLNESELGEIILPLNYSLKGFDLNRDTQV